MNVHPELTVTAPVIPRHWQQIRNGGDYDRGGMVLRLLAAMICSASGARGAMATAMRNAPICDRKAVFGT
jgi:hypothetical protein